MVRKIMSINNTIFDYDDTYLLEYGLTPSFFQEVVGDLQSNVPHYQNIPECKIVLSEQMNFAEKLVLGGNAQAFVKNKDLQGGRNIIYIYLATIKANQEEGILPYKIKAVLRHEATHIAQHHFDSSIKARQKAWEKLNQLMKVSRNTKNILDFYKNLVAFELMIIMEGVAGITQEGSFYIQREGKEIYRQAKTRAEHMNALFQDVLEKYESGSNKNFDKASQEKVGDITKETLGGALEHPRHFMYQIGKEVIFHLVYLDKMPIEDIFSTPARKLFDMYAKSCQRNEKIPVISYNDKSILMLKPMYARLKKLYKNKS